MRSMRLLRRKCLSINEHGVNLADAAAARQAASDAHNHEETPNFAKSIENKALTGKYNQPF
jgi:hypothetical protein